MITLNKGFRLFAAGLLGVSSSLVLAQAQGPAVGLTPANPTILAGQTQQFTPSGTLVPAVIAGGWGHTCMLMSDRSVRCDGLNNWGQLGNGGFANASTPVAATGLTNAIYVQPGMEHTCALLADGTMACWGTNYVGQLGNGWVGALSEIPRSVPGITTAIGATVGGFHNCAILADQTVKCWGRNQDGQIGNGDNTTDVGSPATVIGLGAIAGLTGGGYHTCALMPNATVKCWGRNTRGQLGDGSSSFFSSTPVAVSGLTNAAAVSGGFYHTCALLQDGTVQCWGENDSGQIGNTLAYSNVPITVAGISNAVGISAGTYHSCALLANGTVQCWGRNANGQLGNGTTTNSSSPVTVSGLAGAAIVGAGGLHTCGLLTDRSGRCWGWNTYGQLGNGALVDSSTPVAVNGTGVTWSSSNTAIATIAANGRATGVGRGTATITVTDSAGNTASTTLRVRTMEQLTVTKTGVGTGTVSSSPAGINCGTSCTATFLDSTVVTLTATPGQLSVFMGWTGCDTVVDTTCTVTMSGARSVAADFVGVPVH
jgi:alpha-tubulin suppressor-like RCC1 family protein